MNPFENEEIINNVIFNDIKINIWLETHGRKKKTFISNLQMEEDNVKELLKNIKKRLGCNGSYKYKIDELIVQLQGDHIDYIYSYLVNNLYINQDNIIIKG